MQRRPLRSWPAISKMPQDRDVLGVGFVRSRSQTLNHTVDAGTKACYRYFIFLVLQQDWHCILIMSLHCPFVQAFHYPLGVDVKRQNKVFPDSPDFGGPQYRPQYNMILITGPIWEAPLGSRETYSRLMCRCYPKGPCTQQLGSL